MKSVTTHCFRNSCFHCIVANCTDVNLTSVTGHIHVDYNVLYFDGNFAFVDQDANSSFIVAPYDLGLASIVPFVGQITENDTHVVAKKK